MPTTVQAQSQGFKTPAMSMPEEPVFLPVLFDFSTAADQILIKDLLQEMQNLKIPFIQSVFVDNSDDGAALTLEFNDGVFELTVPGFTQGFYPILVAEGVIRITATSLSSVAKKNCIFTSMMMPPLQWIAPAVAPGSIGYPAGATPVVAAATGTGVAAVTATLPAAANKTTYITGFEISWGASTAANDIPATVGVLVGGVTFTYELFAPAVITTPGVPAVESIQFNPPIPGNGVNSAISVTWPATPGSTAVAINVHGFQI